VHPAAFAARDLLRLAPIALEITQLVVFGSAHEEAKHQLQAGVNVWTACKFSIDKLANASFMSRPLSGRPFQIASRVSVNLSLLQEVRRYVKEAESPT
jgi:hypothetical protein